MSSHRLLAAAYDRLLATGETGGLAERRRRLLAHATGRVLEIGAGTGLNLAHYEAASVTSVVALEPDGAMRRRLLPRLATGPVPCQLGAVSLDRAEFADCSFETVVATLVLCAVPDVERAAGHIARWLVPGGSLLFLEHVRAPGWRGRSQHALSPLWSALAGGCQLDRDTLGAIRGADLFITDCERFALPAGGPLLATCAQGVARRLPMLVDRHGGQT
jgi:SAM-dependent methyltransferase